VKKRLFAGFSISNALNILTILKSLPQDGWENYYIYFGNIQNMQVICNTLHRHAHIKQFYNFSNNDATLIINKEKLDKTLNIKNFDELYLQFNGADYRELTRKYAKAPIYLIEDGLSSYEKHDLTFLFHKAPEALYIYNYLNGFLPHECRYSKLPQIQINLDDAKTIYSTLAQGLSIPYDKNTIIFCAQELFNTDIITYENELKMYVDSIKTIISNGFKVAFKEHPRNTRPFFPEICKIINSQLLYEFPKTITPIELFIAKQSPKAIVSAFSTSLFLSSHLFNCPAYTMNFLKYKTQNLVLRLYDYASVIAQALFKNTTEINTENQHYKQIYDKQVKTLLEVKELEFYRMFIPKKDFYRIKKDFLETCTDVQLLKTFSIHPVVINIIRNGKYKDLLKCNKLNIKHSSKEYLNQLKTVKDIKESLYAISTGLKNILKSIFWQIVDFLKISVIM